MTDVQRSQYAQIDHTQIWQQLEPWLLLFHIPGLGPTRYKQLLDVFGSAVNIVQGDVSALKNVIPGRLARAVHTAHDNPFLQASLLQDQEWLQEQSHHILSLQDERYPALLKTIHDPPPLLYVCGDPALLNTRQLAMVGSRQPSMQAGEIARQIASEVSRAGITVTSGLARGIDGFAHRGAIDGDGKTIAVLAGGVDVIYPQRHIALSEDIVAKGGAIVSEFALGTQPRAGHFPRRNRIISGLSVGTLVVEATVASGSLVTARCALEQGREVFAMPGSVNNPKTRGCHALIRDGACLVENTEQVLQELDSAHSPVRFLDDVREAKYSPECPEQKRVLDILGYDGCSHDELIIRTGFSSQKVSELILSMELEGMVKSLPGGVARIF